MTDKEQLNLTKCLIHIQHVLNHAQSKIDLGRPTAESISTSLDILNNNLPKKLRIKFLIRNHIAKLTNFWVIVSDRKQVKGLVDINDVLRVFREIIKYLHRESERHGYTTINISHPNPNLD